MLLTTNILQRTFRIRFGSATGTCFTLDADGRQYLITARHIAQSIKGRVEIEIFHEDSWKILPAQLVGHAKDDIDITVLAPEQQVSPTYQVYATLDGMIIGQEVRFLGFPYGMGSELGEIGGGFPMPFIKKAIVSAVDGPKGARVIFLDGHNNPGFSGGPVVYRKDNGDVMVIGVVSGYLRSSEPIYNDDNEAVLSHFYNTGIVKAYTITCVDELIAANPIGFDLNSTQT